MNKNFNKFIIVISFNSHQGSSEGIPLAKDTKENYIN